MKLTMFRVQNFKSFIDSGWIDCQDVTAIAGVNEAGKSNLLKALWKLKPAFRADNKIVRSDLPIDRFFEIMDSTEMPTFITARFKLRQLDKESISKKFPEVPSFDMVEVSRSLDGQYKVNFPVEIPENVKKRLSDFIIKIMPGFIYYSNYGNLDSNIYLPQMLAKFNKSGVNTISKSKRRTVKLLLMYIGITPEMLVCDGSLLENATKNNVKLTKEQFEKLASTKERYAKLLKSAGERLSREFNQWWRQGKYKFEFAFDGGNLTIFVTDSDGVRAPLDERSVGIQWFLSFFLVFTLESQLFYTNTIMLLDESGATLHGLAQQDLVRFFDELSKSNQLIYSTHSSYMLPTDQLNRTKIVYKDSKGHSLVSSDLNPKTNASKASLTPISTSLGMQISEDLLRESTPVMVTSETDRIYLNFMKSYLNWSGATQLKHIQRPLVFVKSGVNGVVGTAQLLTLNNELPNVYLDARANVSELKQSLEKGAFAKSQQKIITPASIGEYETIEDLIPYEFFAAACGKYLVEIYGKEFAISTNEPILAQLEKTPRVKPLPDNYREQMAKLVVEYMEANKKQLKTIKPASKLWEKLFEYFE
ncbi:MAG: AAA family ATPase [Clostridia bacterium]|nr:AAA family ATPase [Clostridia bacterium]